DELAARLEGAWSPKSATTWKADNPALGQCSVTALVVHDLLGGCILKTRLGAGWHFYNWIDGQRLDLTATQFQRPVAYEDLPATRDEAFSDTSTEQYQALRSAVLGCFVSRTSGASVIDPLRTFRPDLARRAATRRSRIHCSE